MCQMILIFITEEFCICKMKNQYNVKFHRISQTCKASLENSFIPFHWAHNAWENEDNFQLNCLLIIIHNQLNDLLEISFIINEKDLFRCTDKVYLIN